MASWADVERIALALPEVAESTSFGNRAWKVRGKAFVWSRPLRKTDVRALTALGRNVPEGEPLAARVPDEGARAALIQEDPATYFSIPHFDDAGFLAVLAILERLRVDDLVDLVEEAWLDRAPKRLAATWLADRGPRPPGDG